MSKGKERIPGIVISVLLVAVFAVFMVILLQSKMVPTKLLILGGIALVLLVASAVLLVRSIRNKGQFICGASLSLVLALVLGLASNYISVATGTLTEIGAVRTEYTPVAVYVRTDDPASALEDTKGYTFGILESLDRENTDSDVSQITVTFQSSFQGKVYYTVSEALAEDIVHLGKKKSVTKGKNTIQLSDSESKTLWIGWEDGDGTVKTKQVSLDPPTVYTSKITLNPKKGKLTIKYNGTILTPKKSGDGWHQYELVVGETYQFIAKVPNSKKYKEVNQSVAVQKKSNYTINISRGAGRLSDLILNTNKTNAQNGQLRLSPTFSSSTEEYSAELVGGANTAYLWLKPRKDSTKLKVTAGKETLKSSLYSGYHRYTVKFSDNETKKTIKVTASGDDGTVNTYTITLECYEKFELALVRDLTGRTGANTLTLTLSSPRKGKGYLKVVNPGVNVTEKEIISEGYKFRVNKGNTMLKLVKLASVARDIYVIAEDEDGNRTPRLKIKIKPYKDSGTGTGTRTRPDSRNSTTPSNGPDSPVPSTNNDSYSIDSSSWDDDEDGSGGEKLLNSFDEGLDAIADGDGETVDIDVSEDAGTQADQQQAAGSSADGSVPSDSVLSGGMPIWAIVLILAIAATGAVGIYWFVIRARSREDEEE